MGFVLWAPILYMVYNWYILGSRLGAHGKTLGMHPEFKHSTRTAPFTCFYQLGAPHCGCAFNKRPTTWVLLPLICGSTWSPGGTANRAHCRGVKGLQPVILFGKPRNCSAFQRKTRGSVLTILQRPVCGTSRLATETATPEGVQDPRRTDKASNSLIVPT